jgi:glycerol-3-phosphate acyltransferase PlsY
MVTVSNGFIVVLLGYLFGCLQTAYILGRIVGQIDIRDKGSHNAGASNAFMILGMKWGIITGLVDLLKGTVPVLLVRMLFPTAQGLAFLAGLSAICGHIFPFYLKFKGGKGVATLIGMLLGYDVRWGLIFMVIMVVVPFATDYIAIGSLTVFTLLPVVTYFLNLPAICLVLSFILAIVAYIKHWSNVQRIRAGEEVRVRDALKKNNE